ncbi:hypothetical protein KIP88_02880 [Bradyrhizobium sp. SRL28]|uniref:hypothetical protein n=1 Tax=Bradyrhizobium sp. SRL28 TaxID=2836178 RepID=UPI001BDE7317|nr:hypothetical protein [Bradyrhizobium sp. SRL28]MBT1509436.1 hypothetical protein [Bradyrhizobium sp. SRL28]
MAPRKLTDEMYASIPALIAEGKRKLEIAEQFGVKPGTLQVMCCRKGISLRPGGKRKPLVALSLPSPLPLSDKTLRALRDAAKAMGTDEVSLAGRLLEIIAKDNLYNAVLDPEELVAA